MTWHLLHIRSDAVTIFLIVCIARRIALDLLHSETTLIFFLTPHCELQMEHAYHSFRFCGKSGQFLFELILLLLHIDHFTLLFHIIFFIIIIVQNLQYSYSDNYLTSYRPYYLWQNYLWRLWSSLLVVLTNASIGHYRCPFMHSYGTEFDLPMKRYRCAWN